MFRNEKFTHVSLLINKRITHLHRNFTARTKISQISILSHKELFYLQGKEIGYKNTYTPKTKNIQFRIFSEIKKLNY